MSDFWARRKAAVAAEAHFDEREAQQAEVEAREADKTDAELLAEHDLPEPETLTAEDDFRPFLGEAIPQRLKTRALRCLWRVNPVLANLDGLLDYGEDFTDAATVVENLQTAYQVGRGMTRHVEALAAQAQAEAEAKAEAKAGAKAGAETALQDHAPEAANAADAAEETAPQGAFDEAAPTATAEPTLAWPEDDATEPDAGPTYRRMRITFDTNEELA